MLYYKYVREDVRMRTNDEIIEMIKNLCIEKDISLSELARRVGMAKSAISRYFNGTRQFPLNRIDDFAKALNITPEYLLDVIPIMNNSTTINQTNTSDTDPEAVELVRFLSDNTEYKELITSLKDVSKEDLNAVKVIVDRLKDKKD
jgi:bacteriophage repressor